MVKAKPTALLLCGLIGLSAPFVLADSQKLMQGFPPEKESQVTLQNWATPPYNEWGFRNVGILPSVMVPRDGSVYSIPEGKPQSIDDLSFDYKGQQLKVSDALKGDHTDGFLVIKDGKLIYEEYFGEFGPHDHHLWASSTKSLVGMAAGILVDQGKLDLDKKVIHYIPELKGSAFEPLTVQQVMNMVSAIEYSEDYVDLTPGSVHYEYFRRIGLVPAYDLMALDPKKDDTPRGIQNFLPQLQSREGLEPSTVYEYHSPNVDVIGWIISRQSGMPLQEFVRENIWSKLQTEHDAFFATDADFTPIATGGFNSTLRDFARLGLAVLDDGKLGDVQVFPKAWVKDIPNVSDEMITHTDRSVYKDKDAATYDPQLIAYKNFWWVHDRDKGIFTARGVFGQTLYVNRDKNVVIACFASAPSASNAARGDQQGEDGGDTSYSRFTLTKSW